MSELRTPVSNPTATATATTAIPCLTCTCNASVPVSAFAGATSAPVKALCRGDVGVFREAVRQNGPVVVACTQEAAFFNELADRLESPAELRFVNLRETAGWSHEAEQSAPKIAALLAMATAPSPAPVARIDLESSGRLLIIGPAAAAFDWAQRLADDLDVSVLTTDPAGVPARRDFPVREGREIQLRGYLGAFSASWKHGGPIDLERCTGCGACVRACPEHAIGHMTSGTPGPRHEAARCTPNGSCKNACVGACADVGAINFARLTAAPVQEVFDLVLDLSRQPLLRTPHLPDGYFAPGADPLAQSEAARKLVGLVGEFHKPRYLAHSDARCAHHKQGKTGCTRCIDVCSTSAIRSENNRIVVDAGLCAGCGGCATVCPTGAARHVYPAPTELMAVLQRGLAAYAANVTKAAAAISGPCLLVHASARRDVLLDLGRTGKGLPARVIPFDMHDVAAFGLDYALAAITYGAAQIRVLVDSEQPESYRQALQQQFDLGNLILAAMGFGEGRLALVDDTELSAALWTLPAQTALSERASFVFPLEKRAALDLALTHLMTLSPATTADIIALPAKSPFGAVEVNASACTLCMSCVGACPSSALLDTPEEPRLRFVERNCVQCGLCVQTCPEQALSLVPRLWLNDEARRTRTLNAAEPFHCVSCNKAFGTRQMIDNMLGRLSGHAMFAGEAAQRRLQMCADCRVIDMLKNPNEMSVLAGQAGQAEQGEHP